MVLQRQYFARRREERQQNARRAQLRQSINSFRRQERAPADNNHERTDRTRPPPVSTDFLLLANSSAMDSLANDLRLPKRQRIEEPRRRRREHQERVHQEPAEEPDLDVSNDIRIFDAEGEKTQLFRKRTLPNDFLNSQTRDDDRPRERHKARDRSTDAETNTARWHHFDRSQRNASMVGSRRKPSLTWFREQDRRIDLSRRVRQRREASPPPLQMDQVIRATNTDPKRVPTPDRFYRGVNLSSDRLHERKSSRRNRSPKSSSFDKRVTTSRFGPDEVVEATPSEDEGRDVYKDFLFGISPSLPNKEKPRIPTAQKLLSTLTAITPHFPPIKIDSDDSETREQYRPKKLKKKYEFRSLLTMEAISCEQFSANLKGFESKMLNMPDPDVPFLARSKTAKDCRKPRYSLLGNGFSAESQLDQHKAPTKKNLAPTFAQNGDIVDPAEVSGCVRKPAEDALDDARCTDKNRPGNNQDPNISQESNSPSGMEIALTPASRNPVTLAGDGIASEITLKD